MGGAVDGGISISTGYLNVKDVFYRRSIKDLPGYAGNEMRFRSISSLSQTGQHLPHRVPVTTAGDKDSAGVKVMVARPNNKLTASATHLHVVEKIEEKEEEMLMDEETEGKKALVVGCKGAMGGEEDEEEEENSGSSSASRAIEVWRWVLVWERG